VVESRGLRAGGEENAVPLASGQGAPPRAHDINMHSKGVTRTVTGDSRLVGEGEEGSS